MRGGGGRGGVGLSCGIRASGSHPAPPPRALSWESSKGPLRPQPRWLLSSSQSSKTFSELVPGSPGSWGRKGNLQCDANCPRSHWCQSLLYRFPLPPPPSSFPVLTEGLLCPGPVLGTRRRPTGPRPRAHRSSPAYSSKASKMLRALIWGLGPGKASQGISCDSEKGQGRVLGDKGGGERETGSRAISHVGAWGQSQGLERSLAGEWRPALGSSGPHVRVTMERGEEVASPRRAPWDP